MVGQPDVKITWNGHECLPSNKFPFKTITSWQCFQKRYDSNATLSSVASVEGLMKCMLNISGRFGQTRIYSLSHTLET